MRHNVMRNRRRWVKIPPTGCIFVVYRFGYIVEWFHCSDWVEHGAGRNIVAHRMTEWISFLFAKCIFVRRTCINKVQGRCSFYQNSLSPWGDGQLVSKPYYLLYSLMFHARELDLDSGLRTKSAIYGSPVLVASSTGVNAKGCGMIGSSGVKTRPKLRADEPSYQWRSVIGMEAEG